LRNRGVVYLCLNQYDNSLQDFDKSLEIEPDNAYALKHRETVYHCLKQCDNSFKMGATN